MKKFVTILSVVGLFVVLTASGAFAYSFGFTGGFKLTDTDDSGFAETLNFNTAQYPAGISPINMAEPDFDTVLTQGSYVILSEFKLAETDDLFADSYSFVDNPYDDGFKVYDANNTLLLKADITLSPLKIDGGTASINADFSLNLTNIDILVHGSPVLDSFAPPLPGGAVNFTINIASPSFNMATGGSGNYSASVAPVPEPGTVLLLGVGLLGLLGLGRKHIK